MALRLAESKFPFPLLIRKVEGLCLLWHLNLSQYTLFFKRIFSGVAFVWGRVFTIKESMVTLACLYRTLHATIHTCWLWALYSTRDHSLNESKVLDLSLTCYMYKCFFLDIGTMTIKSIPHPINFGHDCEESRRPYDRDRILWLNNSTWHVSGWLDSCCQAHVIITLITLTIMIMKPLY